MSEYSYEYMAVTCRQAHAALCADGNVWDALLATASTLRSLQAKELLAMTAAGDYTGDRVFAGKTLAQVCASDLAPSNDGLLMDDLDSARRLALQFIAELEEAHFVSGTIKRASERIAADAQARTDWHRAMDELAEMRATVAAAEARAKEAEADARRYRWLRHKISGAEFRRIGITYSEPGGVDHCIDAALAPEPEE